MLATASAGEGEEELETVRVGAGLEERLETCSTIAIGFEYFWDLTTAIQKV